MPTFACQTGESLAHGSVQALDKGGVERRSSVCSRKQCLRLFQRALNQLARDCYHAFLFGPFDHHGDTHLRPHPQTSSSASDRLFDASFERIARRILPG